MNRIYLYVLDRQPEPEGAAYWADQLYRFKSSGAEVAEGFIFSDEFYNRNTSDAEFLNVLYHTFFDREPETDGFNYWLECLRTGERSRENVAKGFIYSKEWADTCATYGIRSGADVTSSIGIEPTAETYAFVERMYTTAMKRDYDVQGREYWASKLANFEVSGEELGLSFFVSDEMTGYGLSNREYINRLYLTFMDREADNDGIAFWTRFLGEGHSREEVVRGFTRSAEFSNKCVQARCLPY